MKLTQPMPRKPSAPPDTKKRYIKTRRKVFEYPNIAAAQQALPRIRRTDITATIVPADEEFETLRTTPAPDFIPIKR